jgi:hypothetical protein
MLAGGWHRAVGEFRAENRKGAGGQCQRGQD